MTEEQTAVVQATADARAAHERLTRDIAALQERLDPKTLARDAKERLTDGSLSVAENAKANPVPYVGGAALLGLLLFRKPIARLFNGRKPRTVPASPINHHESGEGAS